MIKKIKFILIVCNILWDILLLLAIITQFPDRADEWWVVFWQFTVPWGVYGAVVVAEKLYFIVKDEKAINEYPTQDVWKLIDFAVQHGKMSINVFTSSTGKKTLEKCVFRNEEGTETYVYVAKSLKHLSTEQIQEKKDRLIVRLMPSGKYCLCPKWESVNLFNND